MTSLFERIDLPEVAARRTAWYPASPAASITCPISPSSRPGSRAKLGPGPLRRVRAATGAKMDLTETARFAREQIQLARAQLGSRGARRRALPAASAGARSRSPRPPSWKDSRHARSRVASTSHRRRPIITSNTSIRRSTSRIVPRPASGLPTRHHRVTRDEYH